jgi:hypothetical protein
VFLPIMDTLIQHLSKYNAEYKIIYSRFEAFLNLKKLSSEEIEDEKNVFCQYLR